jgi:hypothetical protein
LTDEAVSSISEEKTSPCQDLQATPVQGRAARWGAASEDDDDATQKMRLNQTRKTRGAAWGETAVEAAMGTSRTMMTMMMTRIDYEAM